MFSFFYQNKPFKESIVSILVISMLFLGGGWIIFQPKPVQAIPVEEVASVPAQTIQQFITRILEKIQRAYNSAANWISARIDQWKMSDTFLERAAIAALEVALRIALAMITNEIVKWIQGGGEPRFISDWKGFLKDIADKAGGNFVDKYLGVGWLCESFDIDVKIALLDVPRFEDRVECTISDVVENIEDFSNNFSNGGWAAWIKLTEPQNNFYGGFLIAREEKMRLEAEAREAAALEASAGKGFWSPRVCVQGRTSAGGSCNDKDSCEALKGAESDEGYTFTCERDIATTPGATISDVVSQAVTSDLTVLTNQIGDLADSTGPYLKPYVMAIANALVNRVLKEGLSFVQGLGPSSDDPNAPLPRGTDVGDVDTTPNDAVGGQGEASSLVEQQELLKENVETELLKEQQANLAVLQDIQAIQDDTLDILAEMFKTGCSFLSWARAEIISTVEIDDKTTEETIQITARDVGSLTIKRVTIEGNDGPIISYHSQQNTPQMNAEVTALETDIAETGVWIGQVAEAISATNGYHRTAQEYLDLYQRTLQPPTDAEQAALDVKRQSMDIAENSAIEKGLIAIRSDDAVASTTLQQLNTITQEAGIEIINEITSLIFTRGISENYPQPGTYYAEKADANTRRSNVQSMFDICQGD